MPVCNKCSSGKCTTEETDANELYSDELKYNFCKNPLWIDDNGNVIADPKLKKGVTDEI